MAHSTPVIIHVAALLINTIAYCSAENVYCVAPTSTLCSSCPHKPIKCFTLTEYAKEAKFYFTSNTIMVFLPGYHALDTNVIVANVANLTMHGESSSGNAVTIVCNGSVGFWFSNMLDFKIYSLAFTSCSGRYGVFPTSNYALLLQYTQSVKLTNCSFHYNIGTALVVSNANIILTGNSEFTHNDCQFTSCIGGGGIIALSSNLTFTGNTTFLENNATFRYGPYSAGGAIYASDNTVLSFNGINNFINNSAYYAFGGGAIYTSESTVLHFNGTSNFINNSAGGGGGAIYTSDSTALHFNGTSNFINNSAGFGGGAIYTSDNSVLSFNGNSNFINNLADHGGSGGAIFTSADTILSFNGTNNFISNSANYGGGTIYAFHNTMFTFNGTNNFFGNSVNHGFGGVIYASGNIVFIFSGISSFINNSAEEGTHGGAIYTSDNAVLSFSGANNFISNSAHYGYSGGAICASDNAVLTLNGTSNFISNSAGGGGAIYTSNNTVLSSIGTSIFLKNSATVGGGAVYTSVNTILSFNGTNNFINNSAGHGGAIYTSENIVLSFNGTNNFINNSAGRGGAIYTSENIVLSFNGTNNFINNSAGDGGAIYTSENVILSFNGTNYFISNIAGYGHIYIFNNELETNKFISNPAHYCGGTIRASHNAVITFSGTNNFFGNYGQGGGVICASQNIVLSFNGTNNFINNSADYGGENSANSGGAIYTSNSIFSFNGTSNFISNSAVYGGGAIFTHINNTLTFHGTINFTNNGHGRGGIDNVNREVFYGGAVYMGLESTFFILPNTSMYWENNHAYFGGAIYVLDASPYSYCGLVATCIPRDGCFFQLPGQNLFSVDVQLVFKNNSADAAGSVLYGGSIDNCKLKDMERFNSGEVFDAIFHIEDDKTNSSISSDPFYICPCENNLPKCSEFDYEVPFTVYPGETFHVSVVAVGQRHGTVPSTVRSTIVFDPGNILDSQYLQHANNNCTKFNYTVFSLSSHMNLLLQAEGSPCSSIKYERIIPSIYVRLNQTCPSGFNISESEGSCMCDPRLAKYIGTHQCSITNGLGKIKRELKQQFWVGYDHQSNELILNSQCPFSYCVNTTVVFPLNNTDMQCAYNRSGLLCGKCKEGYSLILGTSQCKQCTNSYLALLIPFAVMGIALVILLFVCKLTVATGTLSGLVFYANIVGANRATFLPVNDNHILSVFIAWLNLDFGIETCFFDGMDAYIKTWLQFVFPIYIWLLVGLMIVVSHYSNRFANLLGKNPVSVLATLILVSYAKVLRTLIAAIYVTYLHYPTHTRWVWLYDANIDYLSGKHIPLFLVAVLVFLFLFLPYTLLLLCAQKLQAISHLKFFSWVNSARLKPFMDSYHAPYKAKHRYWPGMLLVLRFALLLIFAFEFNPQENTRLNLLAILLGTGMLHFWAWVSGGVYGNWYLDALEGSFALNLIILVGATCYIKLTEGNQLAVGYTSVSIAFATFIGILAFQLANLTGVAQCIKMKCTAVTIRNVPQDDAELEQADRLINPGEYELPQHPLQEHANAEDTDEANRRLIPEYTCSSIRHN